MEKKKIDRIIEAFRHYIQLKEEGMVANATGTSGGFSGSSDSKGPTAGFDPVMSFKMTRRKMPDYRSIPNKYKKWVKSIQNK